MNRIRKPSSLDDPTPAAMPQSSSLRVQNSSQIFHPRRDRCCSTPIMVITPPKWKNYAQPTGVSSSVPLWSLRKPQSSRIVHAIGQKPAGHPSRHGRFCCYKPFILYFEARRSNVYVVKRGNGHGATGAVVVAGLALAAGQGDRGPCLCGERKRG